MKRFSRDWALCILCIPVAGCGLLPVDSEQSAQQEEDYAICLERSDAARERSNAALGREEPVVRRDDPFAPGSISEAAAQRELSNCLRSKGR